MSEMVTRLGHVIRNMHATLRRSSVGAVDPMSPQTCDAIAIAVLAAMHEPTDEMLTRARSVVTSVKGVWQAMIDEALDNGYADANPGRLTGREV